MGSPPIVDIEKLVSPIPGDKPVGEDLRADQSPTSLYYKMKDARNRARADERLQLTADPSERDKIRPDWKPVLELVPKALAEKTKDLELTSWLIEGWVRAHGFAGLRDGFTLARRLVEEYWDGIYPLPDEDGLETRLAALTGLNGEEGPGTLIQPIGAVPITAVSSDGRAFSKIDLDQASQVERIEDPEKRQARIQSGAVSMQMFDKAITETPKEFFIDLVADLEQCLDEYLRLSQSLEEKAGPAAPPSSNIKSELQSVLDVVKGVTRSILGMEEPAGETGAAAGVPGAGAATGRALGSREDALRALGQIAEFFRRTEPHSPLSYALERVVRWGRLSLPELLAELIEDHTAREAFSRMSGVTFPASPASGGA